MCKAGVCAPSVDTIGTMNAENIKNKPDPVRTENQGLPDGRVTIVTDSAASLPAELRRKHEIAVVPIRIQVGKDSYQDGVDLNEQEFYQKLDGDIMPTTSSPAPTDFVHAYRLLAQKAKEIISIHITGDGSATCQVARLAAESVQEEVEVSVYDSRAVSMGIGFMAIEAAKGAMQGLNKEEILAKLDSVRDRLQTFVAIPTLKYLYKSGRVRQGQAILASLLSIKPIVEVKDGALKVAGQVRTFSKALTRILDLAHQSVGNVPSIVAIMHANAQDEAQKFAEKVKAKLNVEELFIGEVGPALAIHGGPGMIGIVLYRA